MGWELGFDKNHNRDIGHGVPAYCDHPGCNAEIDRGLSYVCADKEPYGGDFGCGLYFCPDHQDKKYVKGHHNVCERCATSDDPFPAKPDHPDWIYWELTDPSWEQWRNENPEKGILLLNANAPAEPGKE